MLAVMSRPARSSSVIAIAASALVHACLFAWLATRPAAVVPAAPRAPIEFEFVEVEKAKPEPALPAPGPAAQPTVRRARPVMSAAPLAPVPAAVAPTTPALPFVAADTPTREPDPAQPFVPVPSAQLALSLPPAPAEPDPSGTLHAPAVPQDILGEAARDTVGRAKVDRGLVHPYYTALGRELLKRWDADRAVSAKGLKGFSENMVQNSKAFNAIWLEHAAAYGASGTPLDAEAPTEAESRPSAAERFDPSLAGRRQLGRQMQQQFRSTRRATLKVVQDGKGALVSVELLVPSNDAHVDHEAVADIRTAAQALPTPPPEATGGRDRLVSLWLFELVVSITPPVPTFSFEFDEALRFIDTRMPLDRRIYKKVKLLSVE
jgi:hypothetical protein